jgi:N6-adenosine-specific RNA methylase IME4/ParB-like chromosome segregation protein Spo0J
MTYEFHPLANLFPLIEGHEFDQLVADIKANGVREPVILHEGKILDGRNRFKAATAAGADVPTKEYEGGDPLGFVISLNLHRRHLDESQRAWVANKIATLPKGANQHASIEAPSQAEAATLMNVSRSNVQRAAVVEREGAPELGAAVERGLIPVSQAAQIASRSPEEQRAIVERVEAGEKPVAAVRSIQRESLGDRVAALPPNQFRVIYADPPWKYGDERGGLEGYSDSAAAAQYPTMPLADICAMNVKSMTAPDSVLFLWATFPLLPDAIEVVRAWGFTYKTAFVWDKQRANMGNYHNACAELLIIATRGSCTPEIDTRPPQVQAIARGKHSAKPEHFRELVDSMYPTGPRIELFRRGEAPEGWIVWGNEAAA